MCVYLILINVINVEKLCMLYLQLYLDFKILKREEFCHEREINEFQVTLLAKSEMPDKQHHPLNL